MKPFVIADAAREVRGAYGNVVVARVNDHVVRMSVMTAPFYWHSHPDSDETFLGVEGRLIIDFEDKSVTLEPGEMLTVPAGVVHRTRPADARSVNLTVERRDASTERAEDKPAWHDPTSRPS
ncbi:cupin domain-containing protein [Marinivivus vitaminiproducens]|uniref:cupin domain-containing protein n=1 Tax=Marinivivus vitaminiproducens TaxID=3035935 RepID=UPI0027A7D591|nr:cupin domain-containing protein [Geminicoccaceae bacterium SCSIO 64248]